MSITEVSSAPAEALYPGHINYEILTPEEFFADFAAHAKGAGERVLAQTMYIEGGGALTCMADALREAHANGVPTGLHVDGYSFTVQGQDILWLPGHSAAHRAMLRRGIADKRQILHDLKAEGIPVTITNPPNLLEKALPFVGRNHIKLAIVDNVAWVGGLSYRDDDLRKEDFMMRLTDPDMVGALTEIFGFTDYSDIHEDKRYTIGNSSLILDHGRPGKSTIFETALDAVMGAKESIRIISQYSPNGRMAKALAYQAGKGLDVRSITSDNATITEWFGAFLDNVNRFIATAKGQRVPTDYSDIRVHAKALLIDRENPTRRLGMIGSHNLTRTGVLLGTQELALFSGEPEFIASLDSYFKRILGRIALQPHASRKPEGCLTILSQLDSPGVR